MANEVREYVVTLTNLKRGKRVQTGMATWRRLKRILEAVRKRHGWRCVLNETGHFPMTVRTHRAGPVILKVEDGMPKSRVREQVNKLIETFGQA